MSTPRSLLVAHLEKVQEMNDMMSASTTSTNAKKRDSLAVSQVTDGEPPVASSAERTDGGLLKKRRTGRVYREVLYPHAESAAYHTTQMESSCPSTGIRDFVRTEPPLRGELPRTFDVDAELPRTHGPGFADESAQARSHTLKLRLRNPRAVSPDPTPGDMEGADVMRAVQAHVEHKVQAALRKRDQDDIKQRAEMENLRGHMANVKKERDSLKRRKGFLRERVKFLLNDKDALQEKKEKLQNENDGLKQQVDELKVVASENEVLHNENRGLKDQVHTLEEEVKNGLEALGALKKRLRAMGNEF